MRNMAGATAAHSDHMHAEQLTALGEMFGEKPQADDDDGLVLEDWLPPLLPLALGLIALHAPEVALQRNHVEKCKLGHLRSMDAARRCEQHMRRQHPG